MGKKDKKMSATLVAYDSNQTLVARPGDPMPHVVEPTDDVHLAELVGSADAPVLDEIMVLFCDGPQPADEFLAAFQQQLPIGQPEARAEATHMPQHDEPPSIAATAPATEQTGKTRRVYFRLETLHLCFGGRVFAAPAGTAAKKGKDVVVLSEGKTTCEVLSDEREEEWHAVDKKTLR